MFEVDSGEPSRGIPVYREGGVSHSPGIPGDAVPVYRERSGAERFTFPVYRELKACTLHAPVYRERGRACPGRWRAKGSGELSLYTGRGGVKFFLRILFKQCALLVSTTRGLLVDVAWPPVHRAREVLRAELKNRCPCIPGQRKALVPAYREW